MDQKFEPEQELKEPGMEEKADEAVAGGSARSRRGKFVRGVLIGIGASLLVLCCIWAAWNLAGGWPFGSYASGKVSERDVEQKLNLINALVDRYYLYDDEIDEDQLIEGIYSGYTGALGDPYTTYYDEEDTEALMESTSGEFSGIGATMSQSIQDGKITVTSVYADSPAEEAGLREGDILYQVDGREVAGESLETVVSWVKGKKGTEVTLYVIRDGDKLEFTAVRDTIQVQTVEYEMKEGEIGYIRVSEFDTVTYEQFQTALEALENQNMKGLVIDLRNNPGGNLNTVTDMLKLLLPKGTIVSTKDKNGNTEEITCDGEHEFKKPLAVLVNQNSASASEIFTGAVQDYGTGIIVGTTTYGKGVVQQLMDLGDGTCLKLTIAEYYTPSGRSINGTGVEPDVEVKYVYDADNPEADNQLEKALDVVKEQIGK